MGLNIGQGNDTDRQLAIDNAGGVSDIINIFLLIAKKIYISRLTQ